MSNMSPERGTQDTLDPQLDEFLKELTQECQNCVREGDLTVTSAQELLDKNRTVVYQNQNEILSLLPEMGIDAAVTEVSQRHDARTLERAISQLATSNMSPERGTQDTLDPQLDEFLKELTQECQNCVREGDLTVTSAQELLDKNRTVVYQNQNEILSLLPEMGIDAAVTEVSQRHDARTLERAISQLAQQPPVATQPANTDVSRYSPTGHNGPKPHYQAPPRRSEPGGTRGGAFRRR